MQKITPQQRSLQNNLRDVPHKPGVYVIRDRLSRIIYVGKAKDLKKRLSQYFVPSKKYKVDTKTRSLIESTYAYEWHILKSDAEAIIFEGKLIKEWKPKYNIDFKDDKSFLFVTQTNDEFPKLEITHDKNQKTLGPFINAKALKSTIHTIQKKLGIRSCKPSSPTELDYKHCLDPIIKNCSCPCIGKISKERYEEKINKAIEILKGGTNNKSLEEELIKEMLKEASNQNYEKAAEIRNVIENLKKSKNPSKDFTRTNIPLSQNYKDDITTLQKELELASPPNTIECFDISNIGDNFIVASMVSFKGGVPDKKNYRLFKIKTIKQQDDFASMAEAINRRYKRLVEENKPLPDLIIVDGGKGQLSSACEELEKLGVKNKSIIGLAKEFEEIYTPNSFIPLTLNKDSKGLQLLQRIRDEAHRRANGFNKLLRNKSITKSELDDIPSINKKRKKDLLNHFGSVKNIKKASIKKLSEAPNIGLKIAEVIFNYLKNKK